MEEEEAELRNPFPSPPSQYTNYTTHNLNLLEALKERAAAANVDLEASDQHALLSDQSSVPSWSLVQLEKPRVDWILEDGHYSVFGDQWFVKETIPSLADLGGHQLYPADPSVDRRPSLLAVLKSALVTYYTLTGSMLSPPPPPTSTEPPEWQRHVEWLTVLAQNLMAAANDLRPVQARVNLELMMKRQLELRREETKEIHSRCDVIESQLSALRLNIKQSTTEIHRPKASKPEAGTDKHVQVTAEDLSQWADEVR